MERGGASGRGGKQARKKVGDELEYDNPRYAHARNATYPDVRQRVRTPSTDGSSALALPGCLT
jgi:hypothetical protein